MVVVAAKAATRAQILRMKSKMATPLFHFACGCRRTALVVAVAAAAAALCLLELDSGMLMAVSPPLLLESMRENVGYIGIVVIKSEMGCFDGDERTNVDAEIYR